MWSRQTETFGTSPPPIDLEPDEWVDNYIGAPLRPYYFQQPMKLYELPKHISPSQIASESVYSKPPTIGSEIAFPNPADIRTTNFGCLELPQTKQGKMLLFKHKLNSI